ncbi:MAG: phosphotransferase family protein [Nitriliruptorales bacterium]
MRKHLGKRMAFVGLAVREGDGHERRSEIVLKHDRRQRAGTVSRVLRQLRDAGLRPPAHFRVPEPLGVSTDGLLLVQEWVAGVPWADALGSQKADAASVRAAGWLVTLQSLPVSAAVCDAHLGSIRRYERELAAAHPSEAPAIRQLAARLLDSLGSGPEPAVPSHGDLHPKNLLIDGEVVTAVDFDTFALREPAFDVGYAIGELLIMSLLRLGEVAAGFTAAADFWLSYRERGGTAGRERVALHVGRTFLQSLHYELCVLRNSRNELLRRWLELAREWMDGDGLTPLEGALRHR